MNTRSSMSVLFLLTTTVSLMAKSTANYHEIHLDVSGPDESRMLDSRFGSGPGADEPGPPRSAPGLPWEEPDRERRMLSDFDKKRIVDTLNRLRRSLAAPDMYYVVR